MSPTSGSALTVWSLLGILYLSPSLSAPCSLPPSLSQKKKKMNQEDTQAFNKALWDRRTLAFKGEGSGG